MIDYYSPNIDLILCGCGFLGGYGMGALCLLNQIWPKKYYERITGASSGGILGSIVTSGVDLLKTFDAAIDVIRVTRKVLSGQYPWRSIKNLLRDRLEQLMPENCHKISSSRFGLTLTNPWTTECIFVSEFESRQDFIDAIIAGSFIPLWSGSLTFPTVQGKPFVDGGFINNKPKFELSQEELDSGRMIIDICPFHCDSIICPKVDFFWLEYKTVGISYRLNMDNIRRGIHALIPCRTSTYKTYFIEGFSHMKDYVLNNDMIKCEDCYKLSNPDYITNPIHPSSNNQNNSDKNYDKPCLACLKLKEQVDSLRAPEAFVKVMDD